MSEDHNTPITQVNPSESVISINDENKALYNKTKPGPFTATPNWIVNDPKISLETLGAITYLCGKPQGWIPIVSDICRRFGWGRHTWLKVSTQLRELTMLRDVKHKGGTCLIFELLWEDPRIKLAPSENQTVATVRFPHRPKTEPLNKERIHYKEKEITKKDNNNVVVEIKNHLPYLEVPNDLIEKWLSRHGKKYILEKIGLLKSKRNIENPLGWLGMAIEKDFKGAPPNPTGNPQASEIWSPQLQDKRNHELEKFVDQDDWREKMLQERMPTKIDLDGLKNLVKKTFGGASTAVLLPAAMNQEINLPN